MSNQYVHGNKGPVLISSSQCFDPNSGWQSVQVYKGSVDDINALAAAYNSVGFRTENKTTNSQWLELTVSIPESQGSGEVPVDRYEINMDFVQADVFQNPKFVNTLLTDGRFDFGSLAEMARQRTQVEKSIANGHDGSWANIDNFNGNLFDLIQTGFKYTERERPVLVRNRTFSLNYDSPVVLESVPTVYSTNRLVAAFSIPRSVERQLPDDPTYTVENTTWGWKKRRDNSEIIPAQNKVHEVKDWVFDAWSNFAYNIDS